MPSPRNKEFEMARCEDFPCCGHELGCCPDYDAAGRQLNMKCVCGATLPVNARFSICAGCMDPPPGHPDHNPHTWDEPVDIVECAECHDQHYSDEYCSNFCSICDTHYNEDTGLCGCPEEPIEEYLLNNCVLDDDDDCYQPTGGGQ